MSSIIIYFHFSCSSDTHARTHDPPGDIRQAEGTARPDDRAIARGRTLMKSRPRDTGSGGGLWITIINERRKKRKGKDSARSIDARAKKSRGRGEAAAWDGSARDVVVRCGNRAQCVYHPLDTGGGTETPSAWVPVPQGRAWPVGSPAD